MASEVNDLARRLARAAAVRDAGDLALAAALYGQAASDFPDQPEPHHQLGGILMRQGRLAEAEQAYRRTLALAPGAGATRRVLGTLLLSLGRYDEGFALFEARHELPSMAKPALPWPEWRGEDVAGKRLLIWPEQGFGDQIQFARFAAVLAERGAAVTLLCAPALARLFAASLPVSVVAAAGKVEFPDPDYWAMSGSLAWRLGATPERLANAPYLEAPDLAASAPAPTARIGLAWRGNPAHENDANRSLPQAQARRLIEAVPAIDLDPAATGARDFADTAAIMDRLDLVVSVDTAAAHLAGAMGKPAWVLLPAEGTDWRWLRERADSPWYPTLRLVRQQPGEPWDAVVGRLIVELEARF